MFQVGLGAGALARVRFAVSPLMEAHFLVRQTWSGAWTYPPTAWVRRTRSEADREAWPGRGEFVLLPALFQVCGAYVPDFLTPEPSAPQPDVRDELHGVATADGGRVAAEMAAALEGVAERGRTGTPQLAAVRDALERGEREFAQAAADELERFWRGRLAPYWARLSGAAEADIEHRGRVLARTGLGAGLASLHPGVRLSGAGTGGGAGDVLRVPHRYDGDAGTVDDLVLVPSAMLSGCALSVDVCGVRGAALMYPAREAGEEREEWEGKGASALGAVLGHTRYVLLLSLASPRTTTRLAAEHHLTPATVSYHLRRLHAAGLLSRARDGAEVHYRRTDEAERLLAEGH
ncbi:ArsR family transcriptional regulator [Streptomyces albiaxialis]|uniref:ArsR family transcriptional regulator n=1 Tax=Streptomyces albiaxialis TaxID=329523 RepID=A0ABP5HJ93_9ACTN